MFRLNEVFQDVFLKYRIIQKSLVFEMFDLEFSFISMWTFPYFLTGK